MRSPRLEVLAELGLQVVLGEVESSLVHADHVAGVTPVTYLKLVAAPMFMVSRVVALIGSMTCTSVSLPSSSLRKQFETPLQEKGGEG